MEVQTGRGMGLRQSGIEPISAGLCGGPSWHGHWGRDLTPVPGFWVWEAGKLICILEAGSFYLYFL